LNLLVSGGRMFGHDYNLESIQMAVNKFKDRKDIKIIDYKSTLWLIEKISNKEV
jgi:ribosomal protein S2